MIRFLRIYPKCFVASLLALCINSAVGQSLSVEFTDSEGNAISDVVVEVLLPENLQAEYRIDADVLVDQVDKEFVPHVSTVVKGHEVGFPNSDEILHHVYSFSPINSFNIPLYGKGEQSDFSQEFLSTGVVEIGCNIHDWMLAYIYVAETSLTAVSDELGKAVINSIPEGEYELRIWHPRLPNKAEAMANSATFNATEQTELQLTLPLQRDRRIRRAPSANRTRYR